jgi:hypothetical protein
VDRFRNKINSIRRYYVYETPRSCKYEIRNCLLIEVERDEKQNSYTARLADEPRIKRYAWAHKPKKAMKYLIDEIVEMYEDCLPLVELGKIGEPLKTEIETFTEYFYVKGEPMDKDEPNLEPAIAG